MIKVLMLTTNSSLMDGISRHILTIAAALDRLEDVKVAVCTVMPAGELNAALEKQGVETFSLEASNGHDRRIVGAFHRLINSFQPSIIHIHVLALMERMVLSVAFRKKKYLMTVHGISDPIRRPSLRMCLEMLTNWVFPIRLSAKCFISHGVCEALAGNEPLGQRSEVIYNPIFFGEIPERVHRLHQIIGVERETKIIGTSCRIAGVKNPYAFTEVMCKVLKAVPSAHAVVLGDGEEKIKAACRNIVEKYEMNDRFHWLGYRNDAPELVRDFDCFVMTSICEGLPTSLLECMTVETPIAFMEGEGGLKDIARLNALEGPIVMTAAKDDLDGLANGVVRLILDPGFAKNLAERSYEVGKRHFDIEKVTDRLAGLYRSI